jgi:hypothetical protein
MNSVAYSSNVFDKFSFGLTVLTRFVIYQKSLLSFVRLHPQKIVVVLEQPCLGLNEEQKKQFNFTMH